MLRLPVWTPGSYLVREFSRYINDVVAFGEDGRPLVCRKVDKCSWQVEHNEGESLRVEWSAWCLELTVRTPHVDDTHAFFTGSNLLFRAEGKEAEEHLLEVEAPEGWGVFCALPERDGRFVASDYDVLADTPVEAGDHHVEHLEVEGVPHRMIFWGSDALQIDMPRLREDVAKVVKANFDFFGGRIPYDNYDFVFHITSNKRGGLEHLNSTVLATPWRYFEDDAGYEDMLALIAHEHFHTWNVKRIRPQALEHFDYQQENHTTALWLAEGVTSYLDDWICLQTGILTTEKYLKRISRSMTDLLAVPGRKQHSVAEASYDAWIRLYRPDANYVNRTVSYYLKGSIVALLFDLKIRHETQGERSIRDFMRALWEQSEQGGFYDEFALGEVFLQSTGVDLQAELDAWVFGREPLPIVELLKAFGVDVEFVHDEHPGFGVELRIIEGDLVIQTALPDGPAAQAGMAPGDIIVAVDGRRWHRDNWRRNASLLREDEEVTVAFFRRDQLRVTRFEPAHVHPPKVLLSLDDHFRDNGLGVNWLCEELSEKDED